MRTSSFQSQCIMSQMKHETSTEQQQTSSASTSQIDTGSNAPNTTTVAADNNGPSTNQHHAPTLSNNGDHNHREKSLCEDSSRKRSQSQTSQSQSKQLSHKTNKDKSQTATRFKWTKEKSQVALNLVKHGYKPKLVSIAVGCSLRTAQKFVETVTPKIDGESFKTYEIKRRGRKSKDVDQRLEAIKEVLSKDCTKTQVEIAADLKVSNTTVCRDLKRIGASWREKKRRTNGQ